MNALALSTASVANRKLPSLLCVIAVACGIALLTSVLLLFSATENGLLKNAQGVDVIVGAKGSPLQLVLSTIYHGDIPTGNIDAHDVEEIEKNPGVRAAIPLAIGDNYRGYRVVGTTPEYLNLYNAKFSEGAVFSGEYQAVAGADTGLAVGDNFSASHGFSADSDDVHSDHPYTVTGVLKHSGTVLDRLIVTQVASVQDIHAHHEDHDAHDTHAGHEEHEGHEHQITALLLKVNSPAAKMNLPREINKDEHVMAVSPSHVMARAMKSSGLGRDVVTLLGCIFLGLAMLMLLSILASGLAQRRYDLAVLRVLGASSSKIAATVMLEGVILSAAGALLGVILGHIIAFIIASMVPALQSLFIPATLLAPVPADIGFIFAGIFCGAIASLLPCLTAARTDIAGVLAQGR